MPPSRKKDYLFEGKKFSPTHFYYLHKKKREKEVAESAVALRDVLQQKARAAAALHRAEYYLANWDLGLGAQIRALKESCTHASSVERVENEHVVAANSLNAEEKDLAGYIRKWLKNKSDIMTKRAKEQQSTSV